MTTTTGNVDEDKVDVDTSAPPRPATTVGSRQLAGDNWSTFLKLADHAAAEAGGPLCPARFRSVNHRFRRGFACRRAAGERGRETCEH